MKNKEIISKLASGINPLNGKSLPNDGLYNDPIIIRALLSAAQAMQKHQGKPKNSGMPWTQDIKDELSEKYKNGSTVEELSISFERTEGAMKAELVRQGLMDESKLNYPVRMGKTKAKLNNATSGKDVGLDDLCIFPF
jgi:hypothetical protein